MPSVGGEMDTGPSFDINILESQAFYQGMLSSIPAATVTNFVSQGYDKQFVFSLLAQTIELKASDDTFRKKGTPLLTLTNDHGFDDTTTASKNASEGFAGAVTCNEFADAKGATQDIAPLSRLTRDAAGKAQPLKLQDMALFDGTKLKLSGAIPVKPVDDAKVMVQRPDNSGAFRFIPNKSCNARASYYSDSRSTLATPDGNVGIPDGMFPEPIYVGLGYAGVTVQKNSTDFVYTVAKVDAYVTLRSTEGLVQFIGRCLQFNDAPKVRDIKCHVGNMVVFSVHKGPGEDALVSTSLLGTDYSISPSDPDFRNTMQAIGIIQKLIDLQQASVQAPTTVPVHVVP
jgi:hypothetical protein